jgi:hypothetical protein
MSEDGATRHGCQGPAAANLKPVFEVLEPGLRRIRGLRSNITP